MKGRDSTSRARGCREFALALVICLAASGSAIAQDTCDVEFRLEDAGPVSWAAFSVDYSAASGDFLGDSTIPGFGPSWGSASLACSTLVPNFEFTALDDNAGMLNVSLAAPFGMPFVGPVPIVSCIFALDSGFPCPAGGSFVVGDAVFPSDPIEPPPLPPAPTISITVSPRIPVCGDGIREGTEACDDGNTSAGDCCSSTCAFDPVGTPCPDVDVCTGGETCDGAGACVVSSTLDCDDGLPCTHDVCDPSLGCQALPEPDPSCHPMTKAKLSVVDRADFDTGDRLKVNAKMGGAAGAIGDPTATTAYAVCVFDAAGGTTTNVIQIDVPPGPPWAASGASGTFGYIDQSQATDGVEKILLKQASNGLIKFLLLGKGPNVPLPGPTAAAAYFTADPQVTVQVATSDAECWRSGFTTIRNDAVKFKGKR